MINPMGFQGTNLLTINQLRDRRYFSKPLKIEKVFLEKDKYTAYLASYDSGGLKIYGYLTVPKSCRLSESTSICNGQSFPVIIFCKGFIKVDEYQTDWQYNRYVDYLAKEGFIVFKPDYRGHDRSEGKAEIIFESGYAIDVLNAIEAVKQPIVLAKTGPAAQRARMAINPGSILLWGHSLGGDVVLKVLEVSSDVKGAVIWSAPTISYDQLAQRWIDPEVCKLSKSDREFRRSIALKISNELGDPDQNRPAYLAVSPSEHVNLVNCPVQINHSQNDMIVPFSDSEYLKQQLVQAGKEVELVSYQDGGHNLSGEALPKAMHQTIEFFNSLNFGDMMADERPA